MVTQDNTILLPELSTSGLYNDPFTRVKPPSLRRFYHHAEILEYSPEAITAVIISATLGVQGTARYGTIGDKIYLDRSERKEFNTIQTSRRIVYGQDLLLRILDVAAQNLDSYSWCGTFVAFEHAFKGYKNSSPKYKEFIKNYSKKHGDAYRNAELAYVKKRGYPQYKHHLKRLFDVLKSDHREIYENLNSNMRHFGILK